MAPSSIKKLNFFIKNVYFFLQLVVYYLFVLYMEYGQYQRYYDRYYIPNDNITNLQRNNLSAGVILLEDYINPRTGKKEPCIILFRDKKSDTYFDAGSIKKRGEDLKDTARRGLREKSANLFRLSRFSLSNILASRSNNHISYFIKLSKPFINNKYYTNLNIIKKNKPEPCWTSTDNVKRILVRDFINSGGLKSHGIFNKVMTTDDKLITVDRRVKDALRMGLQDEFIKDIWNINLCINNNYTSYGNRTFLNGTYSYYT